MNTAERIDILRRHGLPTAAIAATLGIDHAAVADFVADPSNVPSVPGGGSAFAHLTEDDVNQRLVADWSLVATNEFMAAGDPDAAEPHPQFRVEQSRGIEWWKDFYNDGHPVFNVKATDGSLHWSDGTNPPDVSLTRRQAGTLLLAGAAAQFDVGDPNVGFASLVARAGGDGFMYLQGADGSTSTEIDPGSVTLFTANGQIILAVDVDGDLTVNGAKVTHA